MIIEHEHAIIKPILSMIEQGMLKEAVAALQSAVVPQQIEPSSTQASEEEILGRKYGASYFLAAGLINTCFKSKEGLETSIQYFDRGLSYARTSNLLLQRGVATRSLGYFAEGGLHKQLADAKAYFLEIIDRNGGLDAVAASSDLVLIDAVMQLKEILERLDSGSELLNILERLATIRPNDENIVSQVTSIKNEEESPEKSNTRKFTRFPDQKFFSASEETILDALSSDLAGVRPFINKNSSIFCIGSCFAREIGIHLQRAGFHSFCAEIGESVNNTYSNLQFVNYILNNSCEKSLKDAFETMLAPLGGKEHVRAAIQNADVIVYTLGTAAAIFDEKRNVMIAVPNSSDAISLSRRGVFRTTSVDENTINLKKIIKLLQFFGRKKTIVLTVSPVPMRATSEYKSCIVADCISKSTLRIAADNVIRSSDAHVIYWPSFEMVRWVSGHRGQVFGTDDGSSFHVSFHLVGKIVSAFLNRFRNEAPRSSEKPQGTAVL